MEAVRVVDRDAAEGCVCEGTGDEYRSILASFRASCSEGRSCLQGDARGGGNCSPLSICVGPLTSEETTPSYLLSKWSTH